MGALSGKYGEAVVASSNINELLKWELDYGSDTQKYFSRAGGGAQQTVAGCESGSGSIHMNVDPNKPFGAVAKSGDLVQLTLYLTQNGPVKAYGQARLGKFKYGIDRNGTVETLTIPFDTDGFWTIP